MIGRQMSRRDLMKLGCSAAQRWCCRPSASRARSSRSRNRIAASKLPQPFTIPFEDAAGARARAADGDHRLLHDLPSAGEGRDPARPADDDLGLQRHHAGPDDHVDQQGRTAVVRRSTTLPERPPDARATTSGPRPTCTARARCRSTTATPATSPTPALVKDYVYPNIQDARTLWYHDHGVHITARQRLHGPRGACTSCTTRIELSAADPARRIRRAADHQRRDVPGQRRRCSIDDNDQSGIYGDVILVNGVPWPVDAGRAAQVPLPHPQRLGLALVRPVARHAASR